MTEERARYEVEGQEIRPETMLDYSDPGYLKPEPGELRALLWEANLTGAQAGDLVGVNSRTIRKWTGGEREIPYAAWRLLWTHTTAVVASQIIRRIELSDTLSYWEKHCLAQAIAALRAGFYELCQVAIKQADTPESDYNDEHPPKDKNVENLTASELITLAQAIA